MSRRCGTDVSTGDRIVLFGRRDQRQSRLRSRPRAFRVVLRRPPDKIADD
jgi:hypothetical protein